MRQREKTMPSKLIVRRRGQVLARIVDRIKMWGEPFDPNTILFVDYIWDVERGHRLQIRRLTAKRGKSKAHDWPLEAVVRRDPKYKECLENFNTYAKQTLDITGAMFANRIIKDLPSEFRYLLDKI